VKVINIKLNKNVYLPGEFVTGTITLQNEDELKLRQFFVELVGIERARIRVSHGKHSHTYTATNTIINNRKPLWSKGIAPPGVHNFKFKFYIPPHALPSYSGMNANVYYRINARVDVPMWFDVKRTRTIHVCSSRGPYQDLPAMIHVGSAGSIKGVPRKNMKLEPGFTLKTHRSIFYPGQRIDGFITVYNPTQKRIRKVDLTLSSHEWAKARSYTRTNRTRIFKRKIPMDRFSTDTPIEFGFNIPQDIYPSYHGKCSKHYWVIKANLDVAWAFDTHGQCEIFILR
jgi:hypothetical protein